MTKLASLTDMSVTPMNTTNGAITPYLITFVSPIALVNNDKISISLDPNIVPLYDPSDYSMSCAGVQQIMALTCIYDNGAIQVVLG